MNMQLDQVKADIFDWIENFVERANPALNGWPPCPYARKARLSGTIDVRLGTTPMKDFATLTGSGMGKFEVICFAYDPEVWPEPKFYAAWRDASVIFLEPNGLFPLDDHPDVSEVMNGVNFSQGKYALILVQPIKAINDASRFLWDKGYYNNWDEDYLRELFGHPARTHPKNL